MYDVGAGDVELPGDGDADERDGGARGFNREGKAEGAVVVESDLGGEGCARGESRRLAVGG